ncbi:MAG: hypothetical protein KDA87_12630 [Planctomycetales bacterium]|nr:hypothetical protein [Planctomycetales bacterium]
MNHGNHRSSVSKQGRYRNLYGSVESLEARQLLTAAAITDGYTDKWSYFPGETVELFLNGETVQSDVTLTIYTAAIEPHSTFSLDHVEPQQIANELPWKNGYGYSQTASYTIPADMPSGIYFFGPPTGLHDWRGGGNQIPFIVKDPDKESDIVYLTSTNTPNLYNERGGESAYTQYAIGNTTPTVSFERPRNTHFRTGELNKWMSQQDYDYRVIGDRDMDDYSELSGSDLLIIAGHNEYWTVTAKANFDRFVQEGGEVLILGGNVMYRPVEYPTDDSIQVVGFNSSIEVLASIGMNYPWGGRGNTCGACDRNVGFAGYKIVQTEAPFFDGVDLERGDIVSLPFNSEFDGFPNLGLDGDDATGFPIVDPEYSSDFYFFDLFGFEIAQLFRRPAPSRTLGGWIEFQRSPNTGRVLNVGATDWGNYGFTGPDGDKLKALTANMIDYLLDGVYVQPETGDFDFNGILETVDLERLTQAILSQSEPVWKYDLNGDGQVVESDRQAWVDATGHVWGDVNDDRRFDSADLVRIFVAAEYNDNIVGNSTYRDGDFNGDGDFDTQDLVFVFSAGTYDMPPARSSASPDIAGAIASEQASRDVARERAQVSHSTSLVDNHFAARKTLVAADVDSLFQV